MQLVNLCVAFRQQKTHFFRVGFELLGQLFVFNYLVLRNPT